MKFVIWGAGYRGKKLLALLTTNSIIAFVDSDSEKIGHTIEDVPIIDFATYKEQFSEHFIIISIVDYENVERLLLSNNIYQYFILSECPSEIQGYGINIIDRLLEIPYDRVKDNVIVGSNLYSILLYNKLVTNGCKRVSCYPNEKREGKFIEKLQQIFGINVIEDISESSDCFYITTRNKEGLRRLADKKDKIINAYDFMCKFPEYYNSRILQFRNKHIGQRCFIIATGPSLKKTDLEILYNNHVCCFGVNRIFNMKETSWKPDYYMATDTMFVSLYWEQIKEYNVEYKFVEMSSNLLENGSTYKIHVSANDVFGATLLPEFSEKIEWGIYGGSTVTYGCIQMAIYMGFKEIFLLGVDCNYLTNSNNNYFFEEKVQDTLNHREDRMIMSYRAAKKYADEHGVKIYNATRGGMLEVFERVDFDSLFDKDK